MLSLKAVAGLALQLGFAVSVTATLSIYGGAKLDGYFGTTPYLFCVGAVTGLGLSLLLVWQIVQPIRERAK